ncbi:hypothetical protein MTO96_033168 [Rhipicephalus appendiculatus]
MRQGQEWYNVRSKTQPYTLRPRTIMSYVPGMDLIAEDALQLIAKTRDDKRRTTATRYCTAGRRRLLSKYKVEYHYEDIVLVGKLANAPDKPAKFRFIELKTKS